MQGREEWMGKLDGKVAVVTGASRGIGAEIARVFAAEGDKIICTARTVKEGTHPLAGSREKTVAEIHAAGGEATPVAANVLLPEECEQLVQETHSPRPKSSFPRPAPVGHLSALPSCILSGMSRPRSTVLGKSRGAGVAAGGGCGWGERLGEGRQKAV